MRCQLLSTSRLLLPTPPVSLQPLSYLFGLRTSLPFLFQPSPPLLFPLTPAFFLPHAPLLVLAAAVFFLLPNHLRLLTTDLFLLHPSYRLSLSPCSLPLSSPLVCQPPPRGFPYGPALVILWSCRPAGGLAPALFWRLERHESIFHMIPSTWYPSIVTSGADMARSLLAFAVPICSRWDSVCGGVAGKRPACDADMLKQQQLFEDVIFLYSD
jgi:hypothetical protein